MAGLISLVLVLIALPLCSAQEVYPSNQDIELRFLCTLNNAIPSATTTYNVTINYPNGSTFIDNKDATPLGQGAFNYTINSPVTGEYEIQSFCYDGSYSYSNTDYITLTPSGTATDSSQSINLFGSLLLIIILGIAFFVIAFKSENVVAKISFYSFAVIILIISILYTLIIMQQTLFGFENILIGIESFWFVIKIGLTIGILAFGIVIFMVMLKAWKIKRGLYDLD